MRAKVKVKYRKNSHEKYFEYESDDINSVYLFSLVSDTLSKTNVNRTEGIKGNE